MKLLRLFFLAFIFTFSTSFVGLRHVVVSFSGSFGSHELVQNRNYYCDARKDSISVSTCRFYISKIQLLYYGKVQDEVDYQLIDLFDSTSAHVGFLYSTYTNITSIRFQLGIDSTTNMTGAGSGELDPTKGMYWSWQSGYINLKLEGSSRLCAKNRNEFQYHLGGYAAPNNCLQTIELPVEDNSNTFNLNVDVEQFFNRTDMGELTHVMSPSLKAVELSQTAAKMFSVKE